MRFAHAPQHELAGLGVHLQAHGGVLGDQPGQALRQLVLVVCAMARKAVTIIEVKDDLDGLVVRMPRRQF